MKIKSILLNGYTLFRDSGISSLHITFTSNVQVIMGTNGAGKAQPNYSLIKTPSGWTRMGDMTVGSKVMTPDGNYAKVIAVHPQGLKDIYRVSFIDGRSTECCDDHLWKIYNVFWKPDGTQWGVHTLKEIRIHMESNPRNKAGIFVPLSEPETKENISLPLDPYVLGVILGDGNISRSTIICKPDQFIKDEISRLLPQNTEVSKWRPKRNNKNYFDCYSIKREKALRYDKNNNRGRYTNNVSFILAQLGLRNKRSWEKFIPEIYMNGSTEQKLHLLQGLFDTGGTVGKPSKGRSGIIKVGGSGSVQFCTTSELMAKQVQTLIWSLGGLCKIHIKHPFYTHKGKRQLGRVAYILNVRYKNSKDLFRTPAKRNKLGTNQHSDRLRLRIKSIEYVGKREAQCITIDHPDQLYITDDYIVTHNSSALRQMSLYPSSRSLFEKKGYKSVTVEKDEVEYKLDTDYSKPSSPHLFFENGNEENLNIGGGTDIQKELIVEKLGITPLIDDLIMNRYIFPRWTPAKRKEFIMASNPDQIGFVLNHIKTVSSKIRSCKANLSRLNSRKIIIEQDLLSEETVSDLISEKESIDHELGLFQKYLMDIEVGLRTVGSIDPTEFTNFNSIATAIKNCRYKLGSLPHVERNDHLRQKSRDSLIGQTAALDQRLSYIEENITSVSTNLTDLELRYREIDQSDDLIDIDQSIARLETERDKLNISQPNFEMSQEELEVRFSELETLRNNLLIFSSCDIPLYSRKKRAHREKYLTNIRYRKNSIESTISDLKTRYDALSKRHSISPGDIPNSPCSKDKCPLYAHFFDEYQTTEEQRQKLTKHIRDLEYKLIRINSLISGLTDYFNKSNYYHDMVVWLVSYAQNNPVLHHILRQMDILSVLKTSPNRISMRLSDAYTHIEQWIKLKSVLSDLNTAYTIKKQRVSSESADVIDLVVSIENSKNELYELRSEMQTVFNSKKSLVSDLDDISTFGILKTTIENIQSQYKTISQNLINIHEKDRLTFLKSNIEKIRSMRFLRYSNIETTLRSQSMLKERYTEEIISEITKIEKEMMDLEQIERSLILIPKESTIDFLNDVFDQANRFIESVWTVPLQIELLSYEDPLNYEFRVSGDNSSIRELSECSEGQNEILTLAINLALRTVLGHLDLPLCLDEPGSAFDDMHKRNFMNLLKRLLDDGVISQLFIVSHNAAMHESMVDSETFVIKEDNIVLPSTPWNTHVDMT